MVVAVVEIVEEFLLKILGIVSEDAFNDVFGPLSLSLLIGIFESVLLLFAFEFVPMES